MYIYQEIRKSADISKHKLMVEINFIILINSRVNKHIRQMK